MKKIFILLILLFLTTGTFAAKYWDGQINGVSTPELKGALINANIALQNKEYKKSNDFIDKALGMKSAPEFLSNNNDPVWGPLRLQLLAQKACNLSLISFLTTTPNANPEIEKICLNTLDEFKKEAKGEKWAVYKNLYHRLIQYYSFKKDNKKIDKTFGKLMDYDNNDLSILILGLTYNLSPAKANDYINKLVKITGDYNSQIMFFKIKYKDKSGGNVFYDCIDFLNEYPTMPVADLRTVVQLLRKNIDVNNPQQVKKYYETINRVAFAQPNSEESLKFVSEIIDERKKVEIIFEDIKN